MTKQPIITAQTKQNLIDAFWELYCRKRVEKITIKEITTNAGYNRGTFYEYFADVYDVLEQIEDALLTKLQELPLQQLPSPTEPFSIEPFVSMYAEHNKYLVVLLGDRGDPSFQSKMKHRFKLMIKQILVAQGIKDGFELDYTLEYAISAMLGVLNYWFRQEQKPPIEKLMELLHELSYEGITKKMKFTYRKVT